MPPLIPSTSARGPRSTSEAKIGLGLGRAALGQLPALVEEGEFVELTDTHHMDFGGRPRALVAELAQRLPVTIHAEALSIGSLASPSSEYVDRLAMLAREAQARWCACPLGASSNFGMEYLTALPLPATEETVDHVVGRLRQVRARLGCPLVVMDRGASIPYPGATLSRGALLGRIAEGGDTRVAIDVAALYADHVNDGVDVVEYFEALPHQRVSHFLVGGVTTIDHLVTATRRGPVPPEVLALLRTAVACVGPRWVVVEWDGPPPAREALAAAVASVAEALAEPSRQTSPHGEEERP